MMRSKASTVKILQQVHRRDFLGALEGDGPISSSMADVLVPEGMGARAADETCSPRKVYAAS